MRTRAFDEALAGSKTLIIGRKGSGKSAICLMLQNDLQSDDRCSLITPDEISADEIRRFHLPGIPPEQSKLLIWRYVFAVQVAKFLVTAGQKIQNKTSSVNEKLASVRKFLLDNGEIEDLTFTERFWKVIERLKGAISVEAFSVKVSVDGKVEAPSPGAKAHDQLDVVEAHLNGAAIALGLKGTSKPLHLLVDQIEKVWSNDRESDAMVVGLLLAAKELHKRFEFVVCTVFLWTDIYEQLQFQDRDKLRGDEFHIDWDEEHLLDLISARAQASLGSPISDEALWHGLFEGEVDSLACKHFLISRTLMRPRDIIQLCNACRDTARNSRHERIDEGDIKKALALYSNWKLNDLQNEWSVNYPFLSDVFVLLANSSYLFNRTTFESSLDQVKRDLGSRYPSLSHVFSTDTLLSVLYSIGLLGVVRNSRTCYAYSQNTERQVKSQDREFVIHPCFRNALQSTSAIKLSPFESEFDANSRGLLSRFVREARHGLFESLRPARYERGFMYLIESVGQLRLRIEKTSLPEELRQEIGVNLMAMRDELRQAMELDVSDPFIVQNVVARLHRHLGQLTERLNDGGWLTQDKDLFYRLPGSDGADGKVHLSRGIARIPRELLMATLSAQSASHKRNRQKPLLSPCSASTILTLLLPYRRQSASGLRLLWPGRSTQGS